MMPQTVAQRAVLAGTLTVPGQGTYGFDPISHTYWRDGATVPGATQVLGAVGVAVNFEELCASVGPERAALIRRKRDIGQAVHHATHYADQDDLKLDTVAEEAAGYVTQYLTLRMVLGFVPVLLETPLVSWMYPFGGTPDRVGYFTEKWHPSVPVGELVLADLKTGDPDDAAARFQLAGYQQLVAENFSAGVLNGKWEPSIANWERDFGGKHGITAKRLLAGPRVCFALRPDSYDTQVFTGGRDFRRFACHVQTYWDQAERRKD